MKPGLRQKLAYQFDNFMAKGAGSIFWALLIVFTAGFALLVAGRFAVEALLPSAAGMETETIWTTWLQLTDPGNMNQDNASKWSIRILTMLSGVFGIIFFSAVIAFITTQLEEKLNQLKKGRSGVVEKDHILILGWGEGLVDILKELIEANDSESDAAVVIFSEEDKEEMDDFLHVQIPERGSTRIITRTGNAGSVQALHRLAVEEARSVVILPECSANASQDEKAFSDSKVLKTVLAIAGACGKVDDMPQIVVQLFQSSNRTIVKDLVSDKITLVDPDDMIAKIIVQTSRTAGLGLVYSSIFGFSGSEFYFTKPSRTDVSFGQLAYHYPDGIPLGIRRANGKIDLRPDVSTKLSDEEEIILIAEDDSTIDFQDDPIFESGKLQLVSKTISPGVERVLILGWNQKLPTILTEFSSYLQPGSEIHVAVSKSLDELPQVSEALNDFKKQTTAIHLKFTECDCLDIDQLKNLSLASYDNIIVVSTIYDNVEMADARTTNILLLIRSVLQAEDVLGTNKVLVISEVLDSDNLELINQTGINDAIISTNMVSKIIAQAAEEPDILQVYDELFQEDGSEIYLKPLNYYTDSNGLQTTFGELLDLVAQRDEICLGYRIMSNSLSAETGFGVVVNPPKDKQVLIGPDDFLIVLAEDEN